MWVTRAPSEGRKKPAGGAKRLPAEGPKSPNVMPLFALTGLPVILCFGVPQIVNTWSLVVVKASFGLNGKLQNITLCIQFERFSIEEKKKRQRLAIAGLSFNIYNSSE